MKKNIFNGAGLQGVPHSKFDLGHEKKLSLQMGELVPILCQEILPSDSFRVNTELFARMQALLSPVMHRVDATIHYFFVPTRLVWNEWEDFITGGRLGTSLPPWPNILADNANKARFAPGTLADYLGLPDISGVTVTPTTPISALPFRAYQLIYDEYYRDNQLIAPVDVPITSGLQTGTTILDQHMSLRKSAWEKDYFTSARPNTQLGTEINLPITNSVTYRSQSDVLSIAGGNASANTLIGVDATAGKMTINKATAAAAGVGGRIENIQSVDSLITINSLRRSLKIQEWLEKSMRGGSRYIEQIWSHFKQRSSDARLQRPEYLGGGKQSITISEVLQTSSVTGAPTPLGTMGGHGFTVGNQNGFQRKFEEHGFVIGILRILPKTAYMQGIERMWTRADKFDYYFPEFANLGEQPVTNKEIYYNPAVSNTVNDQPFGYQQRYAEYKYQPSTVHGEFRTSLDFWHMARKFTAAPVLNSSFVEADPTNRIFAVADPNVDKILCQIYHNIDAVRPMPYYSIPSI